MTSEATFRAVSLLSAGTIEASLSPTGGDVHVWQASLAQPAAVLQRLRATLAPEERVRAERMVSEPRRLQFVVARGVLRDILGRYLDVEPGSVVLDYEEHGKPRLSGALAESAIAFSLSHAGNLALYAFTRGRAVGIDVEPVCRAVRNADGVARRFFSAREYATFRGLGEEEKPLAFLRCWTRKEAFVKATGAGFSRPLPSFDVSFLPGERVALLGTRPDSDEAGKWSLHALEPDPERIGAVAVAGRDCRIVPFRWTAPV